MDIKEAYDNLPRVERLNPEQQLEVIGTILSQPWSIGSLTLQQYIAQGLSVLLLDRAKQMRGSV